MALDAETHDGPPTPEQLAYNSAWCFVSFNSTESEPVRLTKNGSLVWVTYYGEPWPSRETVVAQLLEYRCNNTLPCWDRDCAERGYWH